MAGFTPTTLFLGLALALPAPAAAEDAPFVDWTSRLAALPGSYEPSSSDDCVAGRVQCVDGVIREMEKRFKPLVESCSHDAIFDLAYLRTTQEYRRTIEDPDFFEDAEFVNHEDVVFAGYCFTAFDDWHKGDGINTPPAWRIAFQAAANREMPASGNLAVGVNAHIQRDLPFVLADIGLVKPDGSDAQDRSRSRQRLPKPCDRWLDRRNSGSF